MYQCLLTLIRLPEPKIDVSEISEMLLDYIFTISLLITVRMTPGSSLFVYSENKYRHNSLLDPQQNNIIINNLRELLSNEKVLLLEHISVAKE